MRSTFTTNWSSMKIKILWSLSLKRLREVKIGWQEKWKIRRDAMKIFRARKRQKYPVRHFVYNILIVIAIFILKRIRPCRGRWIPWIIWKAFTMGGKSATKFSETNEKQEDLIGNRELKMSNLVRCQHYDLFNGRSSKDHNERRKHEIFIGTINIGNKL